jgi:hypothetical protein
MPGSATDFLENKLLDHTLGPSSYTKPATVWVALYTVSPSDSAVGTEVTGGGYARQQITFGAAVNGNISNNTNVDFMNMPACTIVAAAILSANVGGDMLFWSTLNSNRTLLAGDSVRISTGSLVVSLD